jgi:hypothetical protein
MSWHEKAHSDVAAKDMVSSFLLAKERYDSLTTAPIRLSIICLSRSTTVAVHREPPRPVPLARAIKDGWKEQETSTLASIF